ncbi:MULTISPECIES: copper transporter [unclassified Actinomyces]|uniref:copper transporter n=1 Tax=unclassified Actinomyces TaxID=2609248 RepID=UPI002017DE6C|nr:MULTISPECIES: copper transporter [unclassified Actinomyces]MCL3777901.1 copper transporter [Actinomyces sp. AC-20-1]MCL3788781.1 copper transporter [Actinomyces sp. 187325]MCL3791117.1 copper transporter [Actinomyces sp. 186855]MCL3793678.1 copper transporter [Actinomyces sp. 217892]
MIDFRYHLVSLISVFLALAVGVVLGAGPLQNSLGTALNDQVSSLREDRNQTQARLEATESAVNERDEYIMSAASSLLPGTLQGRAIALVILPGALGEDIDATSAALAEAGATVVGRVSLTSAWVQSSRATYRSTYSGSVAGYLGGAASSAEANTVLGQALAATLTGTDQNASTLSGMLTASAQGADPLMTVDAELTAPADGVVVIGPRASETDEDGASATPTDAEDPAAWTEAMVGLASAVPTLVLGSAEAGTDLVAGLRTAAAPVSTVDSVGQAAATVSVPLALAEALAGGRGHYGFDDGADAVMPDVPEPTAQATGQPAEQAQPAADPAQAQPSEGSEG